MLGNSGWVHELIGELVKDGAVEGKMEPCCKKSKWCEASEPCEYYNNVPSKDYEKIFQNFIDELCKP